MIKTVIYNKDAADNAVTVEDYPWGYKLRTKRKYWIETTKRGDRLCYQTLQLAISDTKREKDIASVFLIGEESTAHKAHKLND